MCQTMYDRLRALKKKNEEPPAQATGAEIAISICKAVNTQMLKDMI